MGGAESTPGSKVNQTQNPFAAILGTPAQDLTPIIAGKLFLSSRSPLLQFDLLRAKNIGYVLSITIESIPKLPGDFVQKQILLQDGRMNAIRPHFEEAHEFIDMGIKAGKAVLVHCEAGISRSATIVTSFIMRHERMKLEEAFLFVRSHRAIVRPNFSFMKALRDYEIELFPEESSNRNSFLVRYMEELYHLSEATHLSREQVAKVFFDCNEDLDLTLRRLFDSHTNDPGTRSTDSLQSLSPRHISAFPPPGSRSGASLSRYAPSELTTALTLPPATPTHGSVSSGSIRQTSTSPMLQARAKSQSNLGNSSTNPIPIHILTSLSKSSGNPLSGSTLTTPPATATEPPLVPQTSTLLDTRLD